MTTKLSSTEKVEIRVGALQAAELLGIEVKATFPEKETDATDKRIIVRIRMIGLEQQLHSKEEAITYLEGLKDAALYLTTVQRIKEEGS